MSTGKVIGGLTGAFAAVAVLGGGFLYAVSPRITERESSLRVVRGRVTNAHVEPGVKMDAIFPHVEYVRIPKWQMEATVRATAQDQQTVRTQENARIYGTYTIAFEVDGAHADFQNIYSKLKIDDESDIPRVLNPKIEALGIAAVISVYKEIPTAEIDDNITEVGKSITTALQAALDEYDLGYVRIVNVMPSGVGLSEKANADLEQIVSEQRKLELQGVQMQVAQNAIDLTAKQTEVTLQAFAQLREAGVPNDQLVAAYYLQLMRDNDKVGIPFVPGPVSNNNATTPAVVVQQPRP